MNGDGGSDAMEMVIVIQTHVIIIICTCIEIIMPRV